MYILILEPMFSHGDNETQIIALNAKLTVIVVYLIGFSKTIV